MMQGCSPFTWTETATSLLPQTDFAILGQTAGVALVLCQA